MPIPVPHFVWWLLRLLLPARRFHPTIRTIPSTICMDTSTPPLPHPPEESARPTVRSGDVRLVRPYAVAHEPRQGLRPGGLPRVELLCAPHGMVVIR